MSLVVLAIKTYQSILGKYQVAMRTFSKKQRTLQTDKALGGQIRLMARRESLDEEAPKAT